MVYHHRQSAMYVKEKLAELLIETTTDSVNADSAHNRLLKCYG